jgi:hypothetical protein
MEINSGSSPQLEPMVVHVRRFLSYGNLQWYLSPIGTWVFLEKRYWESMGPTDVPSLG